MVRGGKDGHRGNSKKRNRSKDEGSDDSDEDYVVSEEGNEESEDDAQDYCSSLDECPSEEGFGSFVDEEEEKEVRKLVRSKAKRMPSARGRKIVDRKSQKRKSASDEEDEDEDYEAEEEEEEEEEEVEVEEEDDDDDDEFTPDEEDCFDEEEELTMKKKKKNNIKVRKQGLQKRGPSKHRKKRRKSSVSKKPLRNGGIKKRRLKRKKRVEEEEDDDDCDFIDSTPIARTKSRTNAGRSKKAYVVPSDSDFVLSGSSDYEYTISEEEREQVKEASQLCGSLKTSLRSSSSAKRIEEVEELGQRKKPSGRKGKEKVEERKAEVIKPVCGICLSEEDKRRLRGTLNCCSHYFCFTCIMEWSKVESRCPLCKQRFETISKPARSTAGVDLRDVVIQVPKRDQVYQPSEEELRSYFDPYENVICSECHQGGDDELMLLCDLCDSSAHTYCVGLGREVPEGNWYCDGCRPVALGSPSSQVQDSLPDQRTINNLYNRLSPIINVGESLDSIAVPSPRTPLTPGFVGLSSPRFPVVDIPTVSPASGAGASTLTGRRWLQRQILSLRSSQQQREIQNLRAINRMNRIRMAGRADGISTVNRGIDFVNSHFDQSRETTVQQARTQDMGTQHQTVSVERSQDDPSSPASGAGAPTLTGRQWLQREIQNLRAINRMRMNRMAGRADGISTVNRGIDFVNSHFDQIRETTVQQARTQDMGTQHQTVSVERSQDDPSSPALGAGAPTLTGRQWLQCEIRNLRAINRMRMNRMAGRADGISTVNRGIDFVNSHFDQSRETTVQQARTQDMGTQHQTVFVERLQDDPSSSLQLVQDSTTTFNTSDNLTLWPELGGISSNEQLRQCSNGSNIGPAGCVSPFPVRDGDNFSMAQEQLQAMVRSHLKALSNNIDLDNGTFKDVATSSMHTLLAACGLEHRRTEVQIVPPPSNCTHIDRVAAGQASLMKGCCLTCFDSFVKDVVKRIMDTRSRQWLSLGL